MLGLALAVGSLFATGATAALLAGALAAALVEQRPAPFGLDAGNYAPTRFTR